jgi:hypothetical protein
VCPVLPNISIDEHFNYDDGAMGGAEDVCN